MKNQIYTHQQDKRCTLYTLNVGPKILWQLSTKYFNSCPANSTFALRLSSVSRNNEIATDNERKCTRPFGQKCSLKQEVLYIKETDEVLWLSIAPFHLDPWVDEQIQMEKVL